MAAATKTCSSVPALIFIFAVFTLKIAAAVPMLGFSSTQITGVEGGQLVLDIARTGDVQFTSSVEIQTVENTAVEFEDFTISSNQISFASGSSTGTQVVVRLLDDNRHEQREEFTIQLVNPIGATITSGTAMVTIKDNDELYGFEKTEYEFNEKSGVGEVFITREGELTKSAKGLLIVEDETAKGGSDFQYTNTFPEYNFQPLSGRASVMFALIDDGIAEGTETFKLTLTAPTDTGTIDDGRRYATVRVRDDEYITQFPTTVTIATTSESTNATICNGDDDNCHDNEYHESLDMTTTIIIIVSASVAGVIILIVLIGCIYKRRKIKQNHRSSSAAYIVNNNDYHQTGDIENQDLELQEPPRPSMLVSIEEKSLCELDRSSITLHDVIGRGAFSQVYLATATGIEAGQQSVEVAVKVLKDFEVKTVEFMKELSFLQALDPHPNIIRFIGCCTLEEPFYLVFEYAPEGNLREYLHLVRQEGDDKVLKPAQLVKFALDVSKGMEFISSKNCVHRDLAIRNVLLGEGKLCKLSDFGLARDMEQYHQYFSQSSSKLPVRWMAPEAIEYNMFTIKTDVWSFGIVLWELVTMGAHPYAGLNGVEVRKMLQNGERLEKPRHCSDDMYQFMLKCWDDNPKNRPDFDDVCKQLEIMLADAKGYVRMGDFHNENYVYLERKAWAKSTMDTLQINQRQAWAQDTKDSLKINQRKKKGPRPKPKPKNKSQEQAH
ncbi:uncharacterized protein [Amphiura filiformis]|uniref:uncharacterized protein isoform X2 n=1 Tax=Amphiura filiformis TaxID=82378 RepID=UPI003B2249EC